MEDFLYGFIKKKLEKVQINMEDVAHFYTAQTKEEKVMVKLMAKSVKDPQPSLFEIKKPEMEVMMLEKIDARLVASDDGHKMISSLIESYDGEQLNKIKNSATDSMRKCFLQIIRKEIGKRELDKFMDKKTWHL